MTQKPKLLWIGDIVAKTATIIAGDNARIEKTEVILRWSVDPPLPALWFTNTFETLSKINIPTINIYKKSNTIIADNSSGLDDSSIILNAKKVIIDNRGPRKTTINVARLENKNLSKILLKTSLFFLFTIFLSFCCKFTSIKVQ